MKKVLLSLALTLAATGVQAQIYLAEFDGIWYQFNSEKMICGVSQHYHRGYDDELIGDGGKSLTSLYLPSTLTTIRGYAFQSCVFTEITIPANVETIEEYGFWTDNLKKISFEDGDKLISVGKKNFEQLEEATIITTNLAFDRWGEIIRDKVLVAAMVDRLTHNAHLINMNGQSYRLKETKAFYEQNSRKNEDSERFSCKIRFLVIYLQPLRWITFQLESGTLFN